MSRGNTPQQRAARTTAGGAPRKRRANARRRGSATRVRTAIRSAFQSSAANRALRRSIRSASQRLHDIFGAGPLGPVRLGLLCCVLAFVAAGSVAGCHFFENRAAPTTSAGPALAPAVRSTIDPTPPPVSRSTTGVQPLPPTLVTPAPPAIGAIRAVWVARFHYRDPQGIAEIMRNCRSIGANTVLWQVRGEATVAYPSRLEPWPREYDYGDPGFDPLAIAIREARENGLRIEAWCNVLPAWKGRRPPPPRSHVYHTRPEWFLHTARGKRQPLSDDYVILNPCRADVRDHIVAVFEEIAGQYEIDGLHLDYVRYAWDTEKNARNLYPRDAETLALFEEQTGRRPDDDLRDWDAWRANQLTRLVSETRDMLARVRPAAALTAAVRDDPQEGYRDYLQNAVAWLRTGLIDAAYPMAYTSKTAEFERLIGDYRALAPGRRVVPGLGIYKHTRPDELGPQLDYCLSTGGDYALFSYESLFGVANESPDAKAAKLREMRRSLMLRSPR